MRWLCDEGVRSYLGRSRLVPERATAEPEREVSRGRSSCEPGSMRPQGKSEGPNESEHRGHEDVKSHASDAGNT